METVLVSATALGSSGRAADARVPFSLLFRGPRAALLAQGTYRFTHPVLGRVEIFVVPVGPEGTGLGYEAIFG